jgi:hypothetical protein
MTQLCLILDDLQERVHPPPASPPAFPGQGVISDC